MADPYYYGRITRGKKMPRVEVDMKAPDFALADFAGREFRLGELAGRKRVVLVFNRGFG
jgi:peroxiredoxin